jgi:hypothetical protein
VNNFMNDIATQLRCTKFFTSLKPGSKWNKQLKSTGSEIYWCFLNCKNNVVIRVIILGNTAERHQNIKYKTRYVLMTL